MHTQTCQCTPILPYTLPGHPLTNINRSLRGNRGRRISLGHNGRRKSKRDTPFGFLSFGSCRLSPGFWQHRSTKCQRRGFGRLTRLMMDSFLQTFRCTDVAKKNGSSGFRPQRIKAWWDPGIGAQKETPNGVPSGHPLPKKMTWPKWPENFCPELGRKMCFRHWGGVNLQNHKRTRKENDQGWLRSPGWVGPDPLPPPTPTSKL